MATVGDMSVTQAWEQDGAITAVFRVVDAVSGSRETSGTEHIKTATADELVEAGVDLEDRDAVIAYLGREFAASDGKVDRPDLVMAVSIDEISAKEATRREAIDVLKVGDGGK